jgi:peptidoglycan/xylan/chitin deacetylase (PgdA/CDA1 family)
MIPRNNPYLKTAALVLALAGAFAIFWLILSPFLEQRERDRQDQADAVSASITVTAPESEDGSGKAGRAALRDGMSVMYATPGWQHDENGWWYAIDDQTCYLNGWVTIQDQEYHINGYGYMDTGWTTVGGKGCYFGTDGIYQPDADPSKLVALTFDAGPCESTPELLGVLEEKGVDASFFLLGSQLEQYGAKTVPRILRDGFEIGNFGYEYQAMKKLTTEQCVEQFQKTDSLLSGFGAENGSELVRFPYGSYTEEQKQQVAKPNIYWDIDASTLKLDDPASFVSAISQSVTGGNIILINEGREKLPAAVSALIDDLTGRGFSFVSVRELAAAHGYRLENGVTYYGFSEKTLASGRVTDQSAG